MAFTHNKSEVLIFVKVKFCKKQLNSIILINIYRLSSSDISYLQTLYTAMEKITIFYPSVDCIGDFKNLILDIAINCGFTQIVARFSLNVLDLVFPNTYVRRASLIDCALLLFLVFVTMK